MTREDHGVDKLVIEFCSPSCQTVLSCLGWREDGYLHSSRGSVCLVTYLTLEQWAGMSLLRRRLRRLRWEGGEKINQLNTMETQWLGSLIRFLLHKNNSQV